MDNYSTYIYFPLIGSLPTFSIIEERTERDGIPLVGITFADGSSDTLVLNKYDNMDGHFIGKLANEPEACVAMVNHPEHAELTIMSDRIIESTTYMWKNNGEVELIPEVFANGETDEVARIYSQTDEPSVSIVDDYDEDVIEHMLSASQANSVPTTAKLQVKV